MLALLLSGGIAKLVIGEHGIVTEADPGTWLKEVAYIITDEEKALFQHLQTSEEKKRFIDNFWIRRDPDPSTPENEYKAEHYRRLQYADAHFRSKAYLQELYIKFGPPDQVSDQSVVSWHYYETPGFHDGLSVVVDPKDAILCGPAEIFGPTKAALMNALIDERLRLEYQGWLRKELRMPPRIRFKNLQATIATGRPYTATPFDVRLDHLYVGGDKILVLVTLAMAPEGLESERRGGNTAASFELYGEVTDARGSRTYVFEDVLTPKLLPSTSSAAVYQHGMVLRPGRYEVKLAVRATGSDRLSVRTYSLEVPDYRSGRLATGRLILADGLAPRPYGSGASDPFILGKWQVVPSVRATFRTSDTLRVYLEVYNFGVYGTLHDANLKVKYHVDRGGQRQTFEAVEPGYNRGSRIVFTEKVPLTDLAPGQYVIQFEIQDRIENETAVTAGEVFTVVRD